MFAAAYQMYRAQDGHAHASKIVGSGINNYRKFGWKINNLGGLKVYNYDRLKARF